MQHLLSIQQLNKEDTLAILEEAAAFERGPVPNLSDKILISFFAEPSTRTRLSFEAAMHRMGGRVVTAADASASSSLKKGETLKDTFRTLSQYGDLIVMRHDDPEWPKAAEKYSRIPIINGGSGSGEHPTQALLDLYTIKKETGRLDDLSVMLCGDLFYGRTVHSLVHLLKLFGAKLFLVPAAVKSASHGPTTQLVMPMQYLHNYEHVKQLTPAEARLRLHEMDVVYMTRIQNERVCGNIVSTEMLEFGQQEMDLLKPTGVLLHPLPRGKEIAEEVDEHPRAAYHERQIKNGVYIRMALMRRILEEQ